MNNIFIGQALRSVKLWWTTIKGPGLNCRNRRKSGDHVDFYTLPRAT